MQSDQTIQTSHELDFALKIAAKAGEIALNYFRSGVEVMMKTDNTPVTRADKECERFIRDALAKEFPQDAILGEEEGESGVSSQGEKPKRKWIIDPIDGTYNYARGIPIFSTLIALEVDSDITLGVIHNPANGETYYAESGKGAYKNGKRLAVSNIALVEDSHFVFGAPSRILEEGLWSGFTKLIEASYRQRGFGDYMNFAYIFEGKAEAMLEVGLSPWDLAAMKILTTEAGGKFSDLNGGESIYAGSCLVSNGKVHDAYLRLLLHP
ncbi:MAG: hypothetical protein K2W82_13825 [Candidatus Obscuribacterales bacterium]|nr:hypothetical protein [Candidatus Obscuribacterales bacterium]